MSLQPLPPSVSDFVSPSTGDGVEDAVIAGLLGGALLVAEHVALWHEPWRLRRPAAYTLGIATLGTVFAWWCHRHQHRHAQEALAAWGVIATLGGAATWVAYWLRGRLEDLDARALRAGQVAGLPRSPAPWERDRRS